MSLATSSVMAILLFRLKLNQILQENYSTGARKGQISQNKGVMMEKEGTVHYNVTKRGKG